MRRVRTGLYLGFWIVTALIHVAGVLCAWAVSLDDPSDAFVGLFIPQVITFFLAIVLLVLLYRAWAAIHDRHTPISPAKAVGLMFVPLVNIFWLFAAVGGYGTQFNRYATRAGIRFRLSPALFKWYVLLLIAMTAHKYCAVSSEAPPGVWAAGVLLTVIYYTVGGVMVARVCAGINALAGGRPREKIDESFKRAMEQTEEPGEPAGPVPVSPRVPESAAAHASGGEFPQRGDTGGTGPVSLVQGSVSVRKSPAGTSCHIRFEAVNTGGVRLTRGGIVVSVPVIGRELAGSSRVTAWSESASARWRMPGQTVAVVPHGAHDEVELKGLLIEAACDGWEAGQNVIVEATIDSPAVRYDVLVRVWTDMEDGVACDPARGTGERPGVSAELLGLPAIVYSAGL